MTIRLTRKSQFYKLKLAKVNNVQQMKNLLGKPKEKKKKRGKERSKRKKIKVGPRPQLMQ